MKKEPHPNHRIRIAHVISTFATGGAENLLSSMSRYWNHRDFEHKIFVLLKKGLRTEQIDSTGVPYKVIDIRSDLDLIGIWRFIYELRQYKPNIIHSHLIAADLLSHYLRFAMHAPVVVTTLHNIPEHYTGSATCKSLRQMLYHHLLGHTRKGVFVACSKGIYHRFSQQFKKLKKLYYIPNGIDVKQFAEYPDKEGKSVRQELNIGDNDLLVLTVSRLEPQKNVFNLIEAAATVLKQITNITFVWAGDGSQLQDARENVAQRGLARQIKFVGSRKDIPVLLKAADLFVLPSNYEGLPLSILEAMAAGVPIVATAVGSIPQVLGSNGGYGSKYGWLVPPKDSQAMATQIMKAINNYEMSQKKCIAARKEVLARYDVKETVRKYEEVYTNIFYSRLRSWS